MAYAAVHSLVDTIYGVLHYSPPETLRSALDQAISLLYTMEECSEGVGDMDGQMIIEAAIKLEDAIEFPLLSDQPPTLSLDLNHDIHCFLETAKETKQIIQGLWEQKAAKEIEEAIEELFLPKPDPVEEEEDAVMVGLCDQFLQIRDKVLKAYEVESNNFWDRVIWISGMAGIGKTALAKKVFHDPLIKANFQYRAFVRMGLKFWSEDRFLQAIRDQLNLDNRGMTQNFLLFLDDLVSLPKLKKLRIQIELAPDAIQTSSCSDHISSLFYLESFQSVVVNSTLSSPPPPLSNFGSNLIKLSLSGFGYPWEDMSKIAEIELLEELRLECYAFRGEKWEAKEMRFPNLESLLIEDTDLVQWTAVVETFPLLSKLTMKNCHKLREIPILDDVVVELVDCNPLAETCIKQWYNDYHVKYSWKEKVKSDDF